MTEKKEPKPHIALTYRETAARAKTSPQTVMTADHKFLTRVIDSILQEEDPLPLLVLLQQELGVEPEFLAKRLTQKQKDKLQDLV